MTKNILAIDLSNSSIRFSVWKSGMVTQNFDYNFNSSQDFKYKEELKTFVQSNGIKQIDCDDVVLSMSQVQSTLIPMNIFNETTKESVFKLGFGQLDAGMELDYNRLPQQSIVNIFSHPEWVKSYFVMNFPRIIMQHEGSHLIRQLFSVSTYKPKAILSIHRDHFLMIVGQHNELKYYNYFTFTNIDDILYYIGFALQQMQIERKDVEMIFNIASGCEIEAEQLVEWYKKLYQPQVEVQHGLHYLTKAIELCV